jgi:hypothetical protein
VAEDDGRGADEEISEDFGPELEGKPKRCVVINRIMRSCGEFISELGGLFSRHVVSEEQLINSFFRNN